MKAIKALLEAVVLAPGFLLPTCCFVLLGVAHGECVSGPPLEASRHVRISAVAAGKPLEGAKVFFRTTQGCICGTDIVRGNPLDTRSIPQEFWKLTDTKGVADLPELAPGYYDVGASINDVATSFIQVHVASKDEASTFTLDLGLQVARVEAVPLKSHISVFQGVVQDPTGAAITGLIVVVKKGSQAKEVVLRARSDTEGKFSGQLDNGTYVAIFFGGQGMRPAIVPFELTKDRSNTELKVTMFVGGCP